MSEDRPSTQRQRRLIYLQPTTENVNYLPKTLPPLIRMRGFASVTKPLFFEREQSGFEYQSLEFRKFWEGKSFQYIDISTYGMVSITVDFVIIANLALGGDAYPLRLGQTSDYES